MNNLCILLLLLLLLDSTRSATPKCPVEADPTTILSCVAIDAVGLVQVTKGNIRAFCTMAERFMECLKTKTRGCFGEDFVRGSLSELIELSQKCCVNINEKISDECPFVAKPQCFAMNDMARLSNGTEIAIKNLRIGDKVLATDYKDQIVSTEIISFLHYENNSQTFFYTFITESGHHISLTSDHLIFVGNSTYIQARYVNVEKHSLYIIGSNGLLQPTGIRSIDVQLKQGYATPITQHGTLIVNSVSSSCYSSIYHHHLGHMAMAPLRWFHHAKQIFGIVNEKQMNENGIHWYPKTLNNIIQMFGPIANILTSTMGKLE